MATWTRSTVAFDTDPQGAYLPGVRAKITLRTSAQTGPLRLGIWAADVLLAGWWLPFIPSNSRVQIEGNRASGEDMGMIRELHGWLRNYDGELPKREVDLPHGTLTLTLDQEPTKEVAVHVEVSVVQFGHA